MNDFRFNGSGETAATAINAQKALNVVLDLCSGIDHPRPKGDLGFQFGGFQFIIAFKGNAVNDGIFDNVDHQRVTLSAKGDIGKKTSGEQAFQGTVDARRIKRVPFLNKQIGFDRIGLDPLRSLDDNILDGADILRELKGIVARPGHCR